MPHVASVNLASVSLASVSPRLSSALREALEGRFEVQSEGVDGRMLNWCIDKLYSNIRESNGEIEIIMRIHWSCLFTGIGS